MYVRSVGHTYVRMYSHLPICVGLTPTINNYCKVKCHYTLFSATVTQRDKKLVLKAFPHINLVTVRNMDDFLLQPSCQQKLRKPYVLAIANQHQWRVMGYKKSVKCIYSISPDLTDG